MLQEKGIEPTLQGIEEIMDLLDGQDKEGGSGHRRKGSTKSNGEDKGKDIKRQLKVALERRADKGAGFHLFNYIKAQNQQNWVILPYSVHAGDDEMSGVVKLRVNSTGKVDRLVFDTRSMSEKWDISMTWPPNDTNAISIECNDSRKLMAFKKNKHLLPEKLRNLPLIFDDTNKEDEYDKFTFERIEPVKGVDELA
ncbi:MAG: hypothetical protein HN368_21500 [Spirochaetales bacterium]|nr:hypothetical protein [Spirochaetales bacterium]